MPPAKNNAAKEDLLNRKMLILRLYYVKGLTRDQIRAELEKGGLNVSPYDLDSTMRKWGFEKNINRATWKFLIRILGKRNREGKKSEVIHCGRRVKQSTINKETNRHQENPTLRRHVQPQSPPPPSPGSQVAVCTPPPHSMEFDWPGGLPWLEFINSELYENIHQTVADARQTQHVEDSNGTAIQLDKQYTLLNINVSHDLSRTSDGSSQSISKIAARIGATMPEAYPGENVRRAHCLIRGSRDEEFVFECLTLLIYTFSNNIIDIFSREFESQWEAALAIIKHSGILNRVVDLKRFNSLIIEGFAESLFHAAIHKVGGYYHPREGEAIAIVIWLLESGQNPNDIRLPASGFYDHPQTPLQRAIFRNNPELVEHLLKAKADPNTVPSYYRVSSLPLSPLEMATECKSRNLLLPLLLKHGASENMDQALHRAIRRSDLETARFLLEHGANPYTAYKTREGPIYEDTALNVAAATGLRELKFILEFIESPSQNRTPSTLITADTLVAAATRNDSAAYLRQNYSLGTSVTNGHGITSLHVAVLNGTTSPSHLYGYDLRTLTTPVPPLWLACLLGNDYVAKILIENGADVNGVATDSEQYRKILNVSPYSVFGSTPLDCVMRNQGGYVDNLSCAVTLIGAGATLTGSELFIAAAAGDLVLLSAALAAGADPNATNSEGKRPLQITLEASNTGYRRYAIVEQLLKKGAIVSQEEVITSIHFNMGCKLLILLLSHGGNLLDSNEEGITTLELCIRIYDPEQLHGLLDGHPEVYDPSSVCAALYAQKHCIAKRLVANRLARDPLDIVEMTALSMAAAEGNVEVLQGLLKYSNLSKVSYVPRGRFAFQGQFWHNSSGVPGSPLAVLVITPTFNSRNAFSAFCEFLQRGFQPDHHTWFAVAAKGDVRYAEALLSKGYKLEAQQDELPGGNLDALCESIWAGELDMFEIMLKAGADFVRQHPYSIHLATAIGFKQWSMMEALLTAGAAVNGYPPEGPTALQAAVDSGRLEVVKRLLDAGADVNQWNRNLFKGTTAPQIVVNSGSLKAANLLLEAGADENQWNPRSYEHLTVLQIAVNSGRLEMVNCLLEAGADVNQWNPGPGESLTALQTAVNSGRLDIVSLLLEAGADVNQWNQNTQYGRSPLQSAVEQANLGIIDALLKAGAEVNAPPAPYGGATALQLAAIKGHAGLAQRMLELGADVNAAGAESRGRTALEGAAENGRIDILTLLLANGACLTGTGRRQYIRSVILTSGYVVHNTARKLLISFGGWSDSDEDEMQEEIRKLLRE